MHRNLDQGITFHNPNGRSSIQIAKDPDDTFTKEYRKLINFPSVIFASEQCKATGNIIFTHPTASSSTSYKEVKKLRPITLADEQAIQALSTLLEECRKTTEGGYPDTPSFRTVDRIIKKCQEDAVN